MVVVAFVDVLVFVRLSLYILYNVHRPCSYYYWSCMYCYVCCTFLLGCFGCSCTGVGDVGVFVSVGFRVVCLVVVVVGSGVSETLLLLCASSLS